MQVDSRLLLAIFIEKPTPFLDEFFEHVAALRYDKNRTHLFVHCAVRCALLSS